MQNISPAELDEQLKNGSSLLLIDVRQPFEHEMYNIGGENIPLPDLHLFADRFDKEKTWVFYCEKGIRSVIAIQKLQDKFAGITMYNLAGGMQAWRKYTG